MSHPNIRLDSDEIGLGGDGDVARIATVTIDRPHRKNACTPDMWRALGDAFREISDSDVRVAVITGAAGDFCAGADVGGSGSSGGADARGSGERRRRRNGVDRMRAIADTVMAVHDCTKPVVAKVDGVAVGAGLGLALAADLTWCSDRSRFSLIFARRGLSLDFGTSWLLPRRIGLHQAKRMAFTGEIVSASRAAQLGMVNEVVAVEELDDAVAEITAAIASGPPVALAISKRYLDNASSISLFAALEAETLGQAVNFGTADTAEAMQAFVEKRQPRFLGR